MNWEKLLSRKRLEDDKSKNDIGRSDFQKDYDRILFSSAFRRLGKKTQVHPMNSNDHIHTRLTHSIEVSSVGRSLGCIVGEKIEKQLPDGIKPYHLGEIVQAACLAHDIGNPPFGHAGEEAIKSWFSQSSIQDKYLSELTDDQKDDLKNFEGNAQGFRILTKLENNIGKGGLKLTFASLGAFLKYPWTTREIKKVKKFSSFISEQDILDTICMTLDLVKKDKYKYVRHPLAYLVEAADDICYRILDLEDAHELKIISYDELEDLLKPVCFEADTKNIILNRDKSQNVSNRRRVSYLRARAINQAILELVDTFIDNLDKIMAGEFQGDLFSANKSAYIKNLNKIKEISKEKIYNEPRKVELEIGSFTALGLLLEAFCSAVKEKVSNENLSFRNQRVIQMLGYNAPEKGENFYEAYMKVLDYISGMTDNYATYMAKQIAGDAN